MILPFPDRLITVQVPAAAAAVALNCHRVRTPGLEAANAATPGSPTDLKGFNGLGPPLPGSRSHAATSARMPRRAVAAA